MAGKKGPLSLTEQIANISEKLAGKDVSRAERLVQEENPLVIKLAFKLLPKTQGGNALGAKDRYAYDQIKAIDPDGAETWKSKKLAEKRVALATKPRKPRKARASK